MIFLFGTIILMIILLYLARINHFVRGWKSIPEFNTSEKPIKKISVSVIIPFKNEEENLPSLFQALENQYYRDAEYIFVDDHSSDDSLMLVKQHQSRFENIKVLENEGLGKKYAIRTAIMSSNSELIITLDADTTPNSRWLQTIMDYYLRSPADLIICPIAMIANGGLLQLFQQFDFVSLVGSGAGAAGAGKPILCNGANLAFRRESWLYSESQLHFEIPSGDDIFLLQSIKRRNGIIRFLKSQEAIVYTQPKPTLYSFLNQRRRWASKPAAYSDKDMAYTALIVFLASFGLLISFVLSLVNFYYWIITISLFTVKWMVDYRFFSNVGVFFQLKHIGKNSFLISLFYPFYIVIVAVMSLRGNHSGKW